ncbi:hypothetical protein AVKW3434_22305 [Acidovorax sp. SUPP3434]|uniref:hypothetical protein n=1 Tax=Acidovorax sp. SUPP3434 TaxID=2920880 RepID=UPI0023DE5771|nr:hypothetical protein [Acidovorax sp. SUPP3434]GKT02172.1 hypothetical protein AVKW3434_22305 [Acidovorax sp. SUPP3434]
MRFLKSVLLLLLTYRSDYFGCYGIRGNTEAHYDYYAKVQFNCRHNFICDSMVGKVCAAQPLLQINLIIYWGEGFD